MAPGISVNEIEQAAAGGPSSEGMHALIGKMTKADKTFPTTPDEDVLTKACQTFVDHKDTQMFKMLEITISARTFARLTKKLLEATAARGAREKVLA